MTDTPPKPKRRRWRWRVAGLLLFAVIGVLGLRSYVKSVELAAWLTQAQDRVMGLSSETVGAIPLLEDNWLAKRVIGRTRVTVYLDTHEEAVDLMEIPDCPADFHVFVGPGLSDASVELLRQRFGKAVSGPALTP